MIVEEFPLPFPLLRFPKKPLDLSSALQRLHPIDPAVPLRATLTIKSGRGLPALLSLLTFRASSPLSLLQKHLPFAAPFSFLASDNLAICGIRNLKVSLLKALASPHTWGAGPFGLSHLLVVRNPFEIISQLRTIFSSRRPITPYEATSSTSLQST